MKKKGMSEVTPRLISNKGPNRIRDKKRRDAAIELLQEKGRLFEISQAGGTVLRLHPKLAEAMHGGA